MFKLPQSLAVWPSPRFAEVLKHEVEQLPSAALPLQEGLSASSYAFGDRFSVMVIGVAEDAEAIRARLGVFYEGIVAGCNCADDPTPVEPQKEYCEVELTIDKATAQARAALAE